MNDLENLEEDNGAVNKVVSREFVAKIRGFNKYASKNFGKGISVLNNGGVGSVGQPSSGVGRSLLGSGSRLDGSSGEGIYKRSLNI